MSNITKLNVLDFSPGIRAEYINENFELVKKWIDAERLRIGGWGVVEGFNFTKDISNFTITVSSGIIINEDGEELSVDEHIFNVGAPHYENKAEELTVAENGIITLSFCPYSNEEKHTITYDGVEYKTLDLENEITLYDIEEGRYLTKNHIRNIAQNVIIVNEDFVGHEIRITYLYANDRIDGVMLKKDGSAYEYEMGIISTSPSQQVIQDYLDNGYYLIGFAYWHVGTEIDVDFITTDRSLRPVYVDSLNRLYLNGKLYTGNQFIYFVEPEYPEENTLWYDTENDILYIWRPDDDGIYSWQAVNDLSRFHREHGVFELDENPDDLQTFSFADKQNLRFVPGKNQLTIVIDQVVLMQDQYTELYDESATDLYDMTGYGFKLVEPLERASVVEVFVDHSLNTSGHTQDLFEKIACFIYEDFIDCSILSEDNYYALETEYEYGNCQLEIWVNGIKLNREKDFFEAVAGDNGYTTNGEYSELTNIVYIENLKTTDVVSYRITRHMATFDNFKKYADDWETRIKTVETDNNTLTQNLSTLESNVNTRLTSLETKAVAAEKNISTLQKDYISKTDKVSADDLKDALKAKIFAGAEYLTMNIDEVFTIENTNVTDYISMYYIEDETNRILLIRGEDYTVQQIDSSIQIVIKNNTVLDNSGWASLYLEIIRFGI